MKKVVAVLIAAIMLAVFVAPGVAFAAKGGNGKSTAPGQLKKVTPAEEGVVEEPVTKGKKAEGFESPGQAKKGFDAEASEEASGTTVRERTGISNALSRIEANLFKAQDKFLDGTRKIMPPGLLRVYEKFLGWLGLESNPDLLLDDEVTDEGLEEEADDEGDEAGDDEGDGAETPELPEEEEAE